MKKIFFLLTVLLIVVGGSVVNAATVVVENVDIDGIYGFGFDIIVSPTDLVVADDFILTNLEAMPSNSMWASWVAIDPKLGIQGIDYVATVPLSIGNFLQIDSNYEFELTKFILADAKGGLLNDFKVDLLGNTYKISNVPIPGAIWLLCSGLIGLAGISSKRRMRKS